MRLDYFGCFRFLRICDIIFLIFGDCEVRGAVEDIRRACGVGGAVGPTQSRIVLSDFIVTISPKVFAPRDTWLASACELFRCFILTIQTLFQLITRAGLTFAVGSTKRLRHLYNFSVPFPLQKGSLQVFNWNAL